MFKYSFRYHGETCAFGNIAANRFDSCALATLYTRHDTASPHRADAGKSLSAKAQGMNLKKVIHIADFAGCMALKGKLKIIGSHADTIIDNLTSLLTEGHWARNYDGKVYCFVETGMKTGTYVWFNYTTPPNPGPPSQMMHWFKLAYNRLYWLSARGLL